MRFDSLEQWLAWQETLHPSSIELGLERPGQVLRAMGLERPGYVVITVAGTNGKGSSVTYLDAILRAGGYRVGCYTSPHLLRYNERVRIDGREMDDAALCEAFERIDQARGTTSLTYFEFGTLAAFDLFARAEVDVAVLEVGMGGRLDAVNLLDPDCALITAVDVDHVAWLGPDRDSIGREKAGILRSGRPAVCSDTAPPESIGAEALRLGAPLHRLGEAFGFTQQGERWSWWGPDGAERQNLPLPALEGAAQLQNASGALMVLEALRVLLPVTDEHLCQGLLGAALPGRFQRLPGLPLQVVDVAHNPQSARELARNLAALGGRGRVYAVAAMLGDKDIEATLAPLAGVVDTWFVASLHVPRGADAARLAAVLQGVGIEARDFESVAEARSAALAEAGDEDCVVVFGSFYTVAEALQAAL